MVRIQVGVPNFSMNNYSLRGTCERAARELANRDTKLRVVRGHFLCPYWGEQAHWWCEDQDGTIIDPTVQQFPSHAFVTKDNYHEWDGSLSCANCGKVGIQDESWTITGNGHYAVCSYTCHGQLIGVL